MYLDAVVFIGLVVVLTTCVLFWYIGHFLYRHALDEQEPRK